MRSSSSGGPRRLPPPLAWILPILAATLVLSGPLVGSVLANHGGRQIGSLLACDRPVEPPRCTSVGDDFLHYVAFDASLDPGLAGSLRDTMAEDYARTRLHLIEQDVVTDATDVIAYSGDFGDNGAAGWVYCPADAPQGTNARGDRWCRHQEMFFNLNPRYGIFFADDASRDHVTCHELGHTLGLRHWGNPPETDGEVGATCMNSNTPNGPTVLHPFDVEHLDAYPYRRVPTPRGVHIVQAPIETHLAGGSLEATGTEAPRSLAELTTSADAVVHGRVVAVEAGREFGPASRPLPYATVTIEVIELIAGALSRAGATSIALEIPLFAGRDGIGDLRERLIGTERIAFLRSKAATARAAGLSAEEIATEIGYHRLVTFGSELAVTSGMVRTVDEDPILAGLNRRPLADVLRDLRAIEARGR